MKCCGASGPADYEEQTAPCAVEYLQEGCTDKLIAFLNQPQIISLILATCSSVATLMIIGMVFSAWLCCSIRRSSRA
ncbi:DgyrCDS9253 [Dimorphilus gyrociliatus]|uniref:DgyrCDS9253 n=1 Tax=Dimorphilus gyrociliatus TaxID=2664684 RepID=A0A7I8VWT2_9ANNE|nr:DgyrCDS9253 [Dimorphilus gyrociliatus]